MTKIVETHRHNASENEKATKMPYRRHRPTEIRKIKITSKKYRKNRNPWLKPGSEVHCRWIPNKNVENSRWSGLRKKRNKHKGDSKEKKNRQHLKYCILLFVFIRSPIAAPALLFATHPLLSVAIRFRCIFCARDTNGECLGRTRLIGRCEFAWSEKCRAGASATSPIMITCRYTIATITDTVAAVALHTTHALII